MRERSRDIDRLLHIREAINSINAYLSGRTMEAMSADPAGFIPQATFHPSSRYYNFFYAAFQNTTYNTITASWTVPGEYKIQFELVKMTGGSNLPLTYGTGRSPLGGRNATFADVVFDTKTLVYDVTQSVTKKLVVTK